MRIQVSLSERVIVHINRRPERYLGPGVHTVWAPFSEVEVQRLSTDALAADLRPEQLALVPKDELLDHARKRARRLAEKPQRALLATKQLLKRHSAPELNAHIDAESVVFCDLLKSDELKEAIGAFFEKRKPDFKRFR